MIVAIDGPAGSGKSTVAKIVAKKLGFKYIDTGAMYRAIAYKVLKENIKEDEIKDIVKNIDIQLIDENCTLKVIVDGEDVTQKIRTEEIGKMASKIAKIPEVRETLVLLQRKLGRDAKNAVLEGRDIGTVVFPDAEVKVFLTASPEERARRRYLQLKEKGIDQTFDQILKSILDRDKQDQSRSISPLKPARDAIVFDTTGKTIDEVVEFIVKQVEKLQKKLA